MRILQVLPAMHVGGVETGTLDLSRELVRRGHQVYVVSSGGELVSELIKAGVKHFTLPVKKKSIWTLGTIPRLRRLIERESIDIVHARSRIPAFLAYWASRGTRATFVTTCHGYYSDHPLSRVMGWGRRVIATSNIIGRRMIETFGVNPDRVELIYRGVDLSQFTFDPDKYRLVPKKKYIIACLGRLSPIKGVDDFIKAVSILNRKRSDVEAWIVGTEERRDKPYTQQLELLIKQLNLESVIKFQGLRRDIPDLLRQVDVLVMPSRVPESFGRVLVEAGAAGTAVVATELGGAVEIIDRDQNGLLVPPADPHEIAHAVLRLLDDPELAGRLAKNLNEKTKRHFSLEKMVDETIRVYREALADRRILIIKLSALGDVVLATPSFRMLRKRHPKAYLALLIDRRFQKLVQHCPHLDEIILVDRESNWRTVRSFFEWVRKIRAFDFDTSVDLQNTRKTHLLAFLAGIPIRAGYRRGWSGRLLTRGTSRFHDIVPPVEHQFRVLQQVQVQDFDDELELGSNAEARAYIEDQLANEWIGPGQKLVGFVLGASRRWATKQWPIAYFADLADRLTNEYSVRIVLIGDQIDHPLAEAFHLKTQTRVVNMTGRTNLDQLVALIEKLDVLVTGDSAPMHIAAALKTPLVALFGPTDPRRHAPPGGSNEIFFKRVHCSPCYKTKCFVGHICMQRITTEEVLHAIKARLDSGKTAVYESSGAHR